MHWACKRNHKQIVAYLLNAGADKDILTAKEELAVQLTSKPEIRRLLGGMLFRRKKGHDALHAQILSKPSYKDI